MQQSFLFIRCITAFSMMSLFFYRRINVLEVVMKKRISWDMISIKLSELINTYSCVVCTISNRQPVRLVIVTLYG